MAGGGVSGRTPEEQAAFDEAVELRAREIAGEAETGEALADACDVLEAAARRARAIGPQG